MKESQKKQKGFFSVGIGLGLFALFSAAGFGFSSLGSQEESVATTQQLDTPQSIAQVAPRPQQ